MKLSKLLKLGLTAQLITFGSGVYATSIVKTRPLPAEAPVRSREAIKPGDAPVAPVKTRRELEAEAKARVAAPDHKTETPTPVVPEATSSTAVLSNVAATGQLKAVAGDEVKGAALLKSATAINSGTGSNDLAMNLFTETLKGMSPERRANIYEIMNNTTKSGAEGQDAIAALKNFGEALKNGIYNDGQVMSPSAVERLAQWGATELSSMTTIRKNASKIFEEIEAIAIKDGADGVSEFVGKELDPVIVSAEKSLKGASKELADYKKAQGDKADPAKIADLEHEVDVYSSAIAEAKAIKDQIKSSADGYIAWVKRYQKDNGRVPANIGHYEVSREIANLKKQSSLNADDRKRLAQLETDQSAIASFHDAVHGISQTMAMGGRKGEQGAVSKETALWFRKNCGK
ncbi:hypothetical protein GW915_12735 [bacterium]|nr:hypothetical protein [bacterium]